MTKLEKIEAEIKKLSIEEMRELSHRLTELQNDLWDEQMERDAEAGKLDKLAEEALAYHEAGRTKPL